MADQSSEVDALLRNMLRRRLWVALAQLVADQDSALPHMAEHLRWMSERAAEGVLWASGPFLSEGTVVGDGMTIFNVATEDAARALMDDEPWTRRGLRTYQLRQWELREGRMTVELDATSSRFRIV
jgi:uncharacterized protein